MDDCVYLDNLATTPMDPCVLEAMMPALTSDFGNPGSTGHVYGHRAADAVDAARQQIAQSLGVTAKELVFTSGATESNNLALRGIVARHGGGHVISVSTEHKAVLDPLDRLRRRGVDVTLLQPAQYDEPVPGRIDPDQVAQALRDDTRLVSVMLANNELGTLQPIRAIADACHQRGVPLHCDATQAVGRVPVDCEQLDVDLLSFSGHKIYGPRGVGGLVVRRRRPRLRLEPLQDGGGQEGGRRSGTVNVPGVVGLAAALQRCEELRDAESVRIGDLTRQLWTFLAENLRGVHLNGPTDGLIDAPPCPGTSDWNRIYSTLNFRIDGLDGQTLIAAMPGLAISSGSACTSANPEPSHVLRAIGLTPTQVHSSLRIGIGRFNTAEEIRYAGRTIVDTARTLQGMHAP